MPIFASSLISRFEQEGEELFASQSPCIVDRLALAITSGTSQYTLPDYVLDIRRITWLGKKLIPSSHRSYRDRLPASTSGTPDCYIYNNIGQSQIKFFPTPNVTIATIYNNLWGSEIINRVVIEFFRAPDFSTFIIPPFFRRRLIKAYVLYNCFAAEGSGQNLKASKYWKNKYEYLSAQYSELLEDLINKPRRLIIGGNTRFRDPMPAPHLPWDSIGIGVDRGE